MTKNLFTALFFVGFLGSTSMHGALEPWPLDETEAKNECSSTIAKVIKLEINQEIRIHGWSRSYEKADAEAFWGQYSSDLFNEQLIKTCEEYLESLQEEFFLPKDKQVIEALLLVLVKKKREILGCKG